MLLHSVKPLIPPDNSYVLRLAGEQHVLVTAIEHYPTERILIHFRGHGSLFFFGLLPAVV